MSDAKAGRWVVVIVLLASIFAGPSYGFLILGLDQPNPIEQNHDEHDSPGECHAEPEQQTRQEQAAAITDFLAKIANLLESPESQEAAERSQRDLEAQEGMALYALWVAVIAATQAVLTVVGIFFVWRTLVATKTATEAATKAAEAAEDAVTATREIGEKQVRAYITIENVEISRIRIKAKPVVSVYIVNSGQSPALFVGSYAKIRLRRDNDKSSIIDKNEFRKDMRKRITLPNGPPNQIPVEAEFIINEQDAEDIHDGVASIYFYVALFYRDVFGDRRRSMFRLELKPKYMNGETGPLVYCNKGARIS